MKNQNKIELNPINNERVTQLPQSILDEKYITLLEDKDVPMDTNQLSRIALMYKIINTNPEEITRSHWYCVLAGNQFAAANLSVMFEKGDVVPVNIPFARIFKSLAVKMGLKNTINNLGDVTFDEENIASIIYSNIRSFFEESTEITINKLDFLTNLINANLHSSNNKQSLCFERDIQSYFVEGLDNTRENDIKHFVDNIGDCCGDSCTIL